MTFFRKKAMSFIQTFYFYAKKKSQCQLYNREMRWNLQFCTAWHGMQTYNEYLHSYCCQHLWQTLLTWMYAILLLLSCYLKASLMFTNYKVFKYVFIMNRGAIIYLWVYLYKVIIDNLSLIMWGLNHWYNSIIVFVMQELTY